MVFFFHCFIDLFFVVICFDSFFYVYFLKVFSLWLSWDLHKTCYSYSSLFKKDNYSTCIQKFLTFIDPHTHYIINTTIWMFMSLTDICSYSYLSILVLISTLKLSWFTYHHYRVNRNLCPFTQIRSLYFHCFSYCSLVSFNFNMEN